MPTTISKKYARSLRAAERIAATGVDLTAAEVEAFNKHLAAAKRWRSRMWQDHLDRAQAAREVQMAGSAERQRIRIARERAGL